MGKVFRTNAEQKSKTNFMSHTFFPLCLRDFKIINQKLVNTVESLWYPYISKPVAFI
jgi:hypothetical protein